MKKSSFIAILALAAGVLNACDTCIDGQGSVTQEKRNPGEFSGIKIEVPAHVTVQQSQEKEFVINAQPNILALIKTSVSNGTLLISSDDCIGHCKDITISVKNPEITKMVINGSGDIQSVGVLKSDHLEFGVNGSGGIQAEADAASIYGGIKGSGSVILKGSARQQFVKISGSGSYNAKELASVEGDFSLTGSGSISVYVLEKLSANVTGSGNIVYKGSPKASTRIEGSGSVNKAE